MSVQGGRGQGHQTSARVIEQSTREEGVVRAGETPIEHERPEDWGWHGETGKMGRIGAWFTVLVLLSFVFGNHEGQVENLYLLVFAGAIVVILIWDVFRRKNAWRSH